MQTKPIKVQNRFHFTEIYINFTLEKVFPDKFVRNDVTNRLQIDRENNSRCETCGSISQNRCPETDRPTVATAQLPPPPLPSSSHLPRAIKLAMANENGGENEGRKRKEERKSQRVADCCLTWWRLSFMFWPEKPNVNAELEIEINE